MANEVLNMEQWGINERGEIVAVTGIGSNNVTGYVDVSQRPVDKNGKTVFANVPTLAYDASGNVAGIVGPNNTVISLGGSVSLSASASANAAALQAAMNAAGRVAITTPGVYPIDRTLRIKSDTELYVGAGVELKAVTGGPRVTSTFPLIMNVNADSVPKTISTISAAVYAHYLFLVTVTFAAPHGLTAGGYMQVKGDATDIYNGVWRIESVSSTTALTFLMSVAGGTTNLPPSTSAAGLLGAAADGNIRITGGGRINMQYGAGGFTESADYHDHGIILRRLLEPVIDGLAFNDVRKYCVMLQDVQNPKSRNIHADTGSDGVHVYGPAWNPLIENITGTYGDDTVVLQTVDGYLYTQYMLGTGADLGGNIVNGTMREIRPRHVSNSGACVFYPNGNTGGAGATSQIYYMLGAFIVDGASTQDSQGLNGPNYTGGKSVSIGAGYVTTPGSIDSLTLRNVYGTIWCQNSGANQAIKIRNLHIEGLAGDSLGGNNLSINVDYANIDVLSLTNGAVQSYSGINVISLQSANAVVGTINYTNVYFSQLTSGSATSVLACAGGSIGTVNLMGCRLGSGVRFMGESSFIGTPTFNVVACEGASGFTGLFTSTGSTNLNININGFKSVNGVFNIYSSTGTINLNVAGMYSSGSIFTNLTGIVNMSNPDGTCPVDLSKLSVSGSKGYMAKSLSGNGTIGAGQLAVSDGTNWRQLSNTTLLL